MITKLEIVNKTLKYGKLHGDKIKGRGQKDNLLFSFDTSIGLERAYSEGAFDVYNELIPLFNEFAEWLGIKPGDSYARIVPMTVPQGEQQKWMEYPVTLTPMGRVYYTTEELINQFLKEKEDESTKN